MCTWLTVVFAGASILRRCGIALYVYLVKGTTCRSFDNHKTLGFRIRGSLAI